MSYSLVDKLADYRVSSVLNNDRKVYGRKFLFDGKDETCWNSDQGLPQWIHFSFESPLEVTGIRLQFQGGFAGKDCELSLRDNDEKCGEHESNVEQLQARRFQFNPNDDNSVQEFTLANPIRGTNYSLNFLSTTDFYGRIIIYNFDILGQQ